MNSIRWRWRERDYGFRFRSGTGKDRAEHYQAANPGEFYLVAASQRKLEKKQIDELSASAKTPGSLKVVANPWQDYERDWDWIKTADGICLNYAGCLHSAEINRREDEGVARAMTFVVSLVDRAEAPPITIPLIKRIHIELMGDIYPFAGKWRTVSLHKGDGPTRWPLPPGGVGPVMDILDRDVLSRTPFLSAEPNAVYGFCSEVMNELLAIHPFREGNGRAAFILGNLILGQNDMLPLDIYDPRRHQDAYYAACEAGRLHRDYVPLQKLICEWEGDAQKRWEEKSGGE
jgi:cell filamentation protein